MDNKHMLQFCTSCYTHLDRVLELLPCAGQLEHMDISAKVVGTWWTAHKQCILSRLKPTLTRYQSYWHVLDNTPC